MKRERRQPTHAEWERITTKRPVVRKVAPAGKERAVKPRKKGDERKGRT